MGKLNRAILTAIEKGYTIDDQGNVTGMKGFVLKLCPNTEGYLAFSIKMDGVKVNVYPHRFQAYKQFGDEIFKEGVEVRHLDGNNQNNSKENIAIGTHSDNMMDKPAEVRQQMALKARLAHKAQKEALKNKEK